MTSPSVYDLESRKLGVLFQKQSLGFGIDEMNDRGDLLANVWPTACIGYPVLPCGDVDVLLKVLLSFCTSNQPIKEIFGLCLFRRFIFPKILAYSFVFSLLNQQAEYPQSSLLNHQYQNSSIPFPYPNRVISSGGTNADGNLQMTFKENFQVSQ